MKIPALKVKAKRPSKSDLLKETEYTRFFRSKEHEIAFFFKLNNPDFDKTLGIKMVHMVDTEKARELRLAYLALFHSDRKEDSDSDSDLNYDEVCADITTVFYRVSSGKIL